MKYEWMNDDDVYEDESKNNIKTIPKWHGLLVVIIEVIIWRRLVSDCRVFTIVCVPRTLEKATLKRKTKYV